VKTQVAPAPAAAKEEKKPPPQAETTGLSAIAGQGATADDEAAKAEVEKQMQVARAIDRAFKHALEAPHAQARIGSL
jgi:hypothetical protein